MIRMRRSSDGASPHILATCSQMLAILCLFLAWSRSSSGQDLVQSELVETSTGLCGTFVRDLSRYYNCEEYKVTTRSGFHLGVQRLWSKLHNPPRRGPAFLYHGIMQGADIWVMNPQKQSLGFVLADAGYEVYLGNSRSSNFSFGHTHYTWKDKRFWDWGLDELAGEDLPTMLRFVHSRTNAKIHYVGYSQGTMSAFAAWGSNKEMTGMIAKAAMLSPVSYVSNIQSKLAEAAAWLYVDELLEAAGIFEFSAYDKVLRSIASVACSRTSCYPDVVTAITGPNCCINSTHYTYYTKYQLQPTSLKNVHHLAQLLRSRRFAKFDYGFWGNLQRYRSFSPPAYSLSQISIPLLLAHGGKDDLADPADVSQLMKQLKNKPQVIYLPDYAHGDFILSMKAGSDVYDRVLTFFSS